MMLGGLLYFFAVSFILHVVRAAPWPTGPQINYQGSWSSVTIENCQNSVTFQGSNTRLYFYNVTFLSCGDITLAEDVTNVSMNNVTFINCSSIWLEWNAKLTIENGFFINARHSSIYSNGHNEVICTNCVFIDPYSMDIGAAIAIMGDSALVWNGGSCINPKADWGGCLYLEIMSHATVKDVHMVGGHTNYGGHIFVNIDSVLVLDNVTMTNGYSTVMGGCIYAYSNCSFQISDVTFRDCKSGGDGGALALESKNNADMKRVMFESNGAADDGGALYLTASKATISNSSAARNSADKRGGFSFISDYFSKLIISESIVQANQAGMGGAIYCNDYCVGKLTSTRFEDNIANSDGGALYLRSSRVEIFKDCELIRNTALGSVEEPSSGGAIGAGHQSAIYLKGAKIKLQHNAGSVGGAIAIWGKSNLYFEKEAIDITATNNMGQTGNFVAVMDNSLLSIDHMVPLVTGDIFFEDPKQANPVAKNLFPQCVFRSPPTTLVALARDEKPLFVNQDIPAITIQAKDAFDNDQKIDMYAPIILTVTESSGLLGILGETTKAIVDMESKSVTFEGLRFEKTVPGNYTIIAQSIDEKLNIPGLAFHIVYTNCSESERLILNENRCTPFFTVPDVLVYTFLGMSICTILICSALLYAVSAGWRRVAGIVLSLGSTLAPYECIPMRWLETLGFFLVMGTYSSLTSKSLLLIMGSASMYLAFWTIFEPTTAIEDVDRRVCRSTIAGQVIIYFKIMIELAVMIAHKLDRPRSENQGEIFYFSFFNNASNQRTSVANDSFEVGSRNKKRTGLSQDTLKEGEENHGTVQDEKRILFVYTWFIGSCIEVMVENLRLDPILSYSLGCFRIILPALVSSALLFSVSTSK